MIENIKEHYAKHSRKVSAAVFILYLVVWFSGPTFLNLFQGDLAILLGFSLVLLYLVLIQDTLLGIRDNKKSREIFDNQDGANDLLRKIVEEENIYEVKMIEYDADSVKWLIDRVLKKGATVHLLLQHPEHTVNEWQRIRVETQIRKILSDFDAYKNKITIEFYKDTASLRGRLIDNRHLNIGWYTYDRRRNIGEAQVSGHSNPIIHITRKDQSFDAMCAFYSTVFENLRKNADSYDVVRNILDKTSPLYKSRPLITLEDFALALVDIAEEAGEIAQRYYGSFVNEEVEDDHSSASKQVSFVDRQIEENIVENLKKLPLSSSIVGRVKGTKTCTEDFCWVINPIDGLRWFDRTLPFFSITISLYDNVKKCPQVGVIYQPKMGQMWYAFKDGGSYVNKVKRTVSQIDILRDAQIYVDVDSIEAIPPDERMWVDEKLSQLQHACNRVRMIGAGAVAATWVAGGAMDAFVDLTGYNPVWDMIAPRAIMTEAGAVESFVQTPHGPAKYVAANPKLIGELDALLKS